MDSFQIAIIAVVVGVVGTAAAIFSAANAWRATRQNELLLAQSDEVLRITRERQFMDGYMFVRLRTVTSNDSVQITGTSGGAASPQCILLYSWRGDLWMGSTAVPAHPGTFGTSLVRLPCREEGLASPNEPELVRAVARDLMRVWWDITTSGDQAPDSLGESPLPSLCAAVEDWSRGILTIETLEVNVESVKCSIGSKSR